MLGASWSVLSACGFKVRLNIEKGIMDPSSLSALLVLATPEIRDLLFSRRCFFDCILSFFFALLEEIGFVYGGDGFGASLCETSSSFLVELRGDETAVL